jgi:4-aminobutyrate aminotransferase-like enzyme
MDPIVPFCEQGSGSRLFDETGQSYLDTRNNVAHCGHSHPRVVEAVQQQVAFLNTNTRYLHPNVALLAERLANLLPDPLEVVFFCNSGSEANDLALRLARLYSRSRNTIVVDGAYHGHTHATMEISPFKYERSSEFSLIHPAAGVDFMTPGKHIWKVPCPDTYRGQYREWSETAGANYAAFVEEACQYYREKRGDKVAAFIMEGGVSVGGAILPPPTYLHRCAKAVREAGGIYIADEVQTGFGRLGSCFWGFQHSDPGNPVVPDIVTVGKAFGNAMPLAAVVTTRQVAQVFEENGGEYFNTFGGNPVCAAAGLAVLDIIESEHLQQRASDVGDYLKSGFLKLQKRFNIIGDVRGSGLFLGIELVRNRETLEPATLETSFLCTTLKEKYKILTSIDGKYENILVIKPPMVFSKADADLFLKCFEQAVGDLQAIPDVNSISKTPT